MSSHFLKYILGAFCLAAIFSCQTTPTKGINQGQVAVEESQDPIRSFLKLKPVILDARNPLDFSVSHAPGAISAQWQDFNKVQPGHRGLLQEDELAIARRLSLWGIDPETPVLVVGSGLQGQGEEGRIAWMLKYLGVKNVQFASWTVVRATIPRPEAGPENKSMWKPQSQLIYLATLEEFKMAVFDGPVPPTKARLKSLQLNHANASVLTKDSLVLDVMESVTPATFAGKLTVPIKKISWKKFINSEGLPNSAVLVDFKSENINKNKMIFVISENGVSSAAVTFILREWGYQAKNFSGGYELLQKVSQ